MTDKEDEADGKKVLDAIEETIAGLKEDGVDLHFIYVGLITVGVSGAFDIAPGYDAARSMVLNILYDVANARPSETAADLTTDESPGQNAPSTKTLQ